MSIFPRPSKAYASYGGALPGRVSTYFNNPYMNQIADNLSSAIYGDPRDELVREQIQNAQFDRKRKVAQDEIAAQKLADEKMYRDNWVAAMLAAEGEPDPAKRRRLQMEATGEHYKGTGQLSEAMLPYLFNQQYQADIARDTHQGNIESGHIDERHLNDRSMAELEYALDALLAKQSHGYDIERDRYTRTHDLNQALLGEGLWSQVLMDNPSDLYLKSPGEVGELGALPFDDPNSPYYAGGSSGTKPNEVSGKDNKDHTETLMRNIADMLGLENPEEVAEYMDDPSQLEVYLREGSRLYGENPNNSPKANAELMELLNIVAKPGSTGVPFWPFDNESRSLSITPREQKRTIQYDAQGNRIQ